MPSVVRVGNHRQILWAVVSTHTVDVMYVLVTSQPSALVNTRNVSMYIDLPPLAGKRVGPVNEIGITKNAILTYSFLPVWVELHLNPLRP